MKKNPRIFCSHWDDYELIDAGNELKLERWGSIITIRPERQAYFKPSLSKEEWRSMAHWEFIEGKGQTGTWKPIGLQKQEPWLISYQNLKFNLELTQFKHVGLFPEQSENWKFISENLSPSEKFLNLFAYTGASSIVARNQGAEVTHCDSIRQLVDWSNKNQQSSQLDGIRWVVDDALTFAQREVKRGNKYNMIQMDPPAFGLGKKGQKWKLENKIDDLVKAAFDLLEPNGWLILNTYSPKLELPELTKCVSSIFDKSPETAVQLWNKTQQGNRLFTGDLIRIQKPN